MFRKYISFLIIAFMVIAGSCKKEMNTKIESLSKSGQEFYFGERVPVWAAVSGVRD